MLDPEISARDARRLLSAVPDPADDAPMVGGWSRRRFLQAVAAGVGAGLTLGTLAEQLLGTSLPEAWAGSPIGANDGILVHLLLYGGCDGLNVVVPYTNGLYYDWRSGGTSIAASAVRPLDGSFGLHPALTTVKSLWDAGQVAVVHGVGYEPPDLSHFSSMAIWMNGTLRANPGTGWLGRWADGQASDSGVTLTTVGTSVPLHLIGAARRAVAVPDSATMLGASTDAASQRAYVALRAMSTPAGRGPWHDAYSATLRGTVDVAADLSPVFTPALTGGDFVKKLTMAARLINRDIGVRVVDVGVGSFDHHDGEPGRLAALLADLDAGIAAFYATLDPAWRSRVALMTTSEFGRTVQGNSSQGTDHGTANAHLVIGSNVRGGMFGAAPALPAKTTGNQWKRVTSTVDFRTLFGSVIDGWLGGGGSTVVGGTFSDLQLFSRGPGVDAPAVTVAAPPTSSVPVTGAELVPLSPRRLVDTRDGTGGRIGALGADETWSFGVTGGDVPDDAVAVALNVTSTEATGPTFLSVWAAGEGRPATSNLNPVPGRSVPNLVVTRTGAGGSVSIYNRQHTVHAVVDLVGFFRPGSASGIVGLVPQRLLDTRDGTGGTLGAVGAGGTVDVAVAGIGAVPAGAIGAVLNVTATEPSADSYLAVAPSGAERATASSVNMRTGQTVANLVMAKLGDGGRVGVFNYAGASHVVVDVLAAFVPGADGRFVAVGPNRLLDTRDGTGGVLGPVGRTPLALPLAGRAGLPADGISAVLMNVTVVEPTADTYLTVYPSDAARPTASNVNATAGTIVPNMCLACLGADGAVDVFNLAGETHLVVDVFGYWT
ncbi:MAG: DUF1501 domain-containing protein [Ilumatobacteraceae bacterium]